MEILLCAEEEGRHSKPEAAQFKHECMPVIYMHNGMVHNKSNGKVRLAITTTLRKHMKSAYAIDARYIWIENELFGRLDNIKQIVLYPPDKSGSFPQFAWSAKRASSWRMSSRIIVA